MSTSLCIPNNYIGRKRCLDFLHSGKGHRRLSGGLRLRSPFRDLGEDFGLALQSRLRDVHIQSLFMLMGDGQPDPFSTIENQGSLSEILCPELCRSPDEL